MMLPAMKRIAEMRLSGVAPADRVWLLVGDYEQRRWWLEENAVPDVVIPPGVALSRLDVRPLVGLRVSVQADQYSPALMKFCERLREYAKELDVFFIDNLPDSIGFRWDRGQEIVSFDGERA